MTKPSGKIVESGLVQAYRPRQLGVVTTQVGDDTFTKRYLDPEATVSGSDYNYLLGVVSVLGEELTLLMEDVKGLKAQ
jgi:hypothetical protein